MKRSLFALSCWFLAPAAFAILDSNSNGVSDLWERDFNDGILFDASFNPQADSDADGWTNAQEAAAGTDPFDSNPPDGLILPNIIHVPAVMGEENGVPFVDTPEAVTVTWPTIPGKRYHLLVSTDLSQGSWIEVPDSDFIGNGNLPEFHFTTAESDKLFWRVAVSDTDSDSDGLTNAEEAMLGTNSHRWDSDGDGIADLDEVLNGYSPSIGDEDANGVADGWDDSDMDGYSDLEELAAGTNPRDFSSKPDGISTDTLLVRNATLSATQIGARGSKDFAFRELKPAAPDSAATTSFPKFYLSHEESSGLRQEIDYYTKHIYWDTSGNIYPDMTALWASVGTNDEPTETGLLWERGTPDSPNTAAIPYRLASTDDFWIARSLTVSSKGYTMSEPDSVTLSYTTGDPESNYFDFSSWTNGAEDPAAWDIYQSSVRISEDGPDTRETIDSVSGHYSYSDEVATIRDSYARSTTSKTALTSEYSDDALSADVDEALSDARSAAAGGASPGITGSASITSRGIADHQWSADHIKHLKMDSKVMLSTTVTQSGVRKVVFLWSELLHPDPASPGQAAPGATLKIRRVIKSNASTYAPGSTVVSGEIEVLHPAEPGYIEIPGPSGVDTPDRLQTTPLSHSAIPPSPPLAPLHVHSSLPDRGIPVTLENTGDAQIRIWRELNGSFSQVTLPYTLGAEQRAGQTSRPASLHIQGLAPGTARLALKAQGQEIAFKVVRVFDFDLDTDSDNTGQIDATTTEDGVEYTAEDPGVIVSPNGDGDEDTDGTPNRDDLDNAGEFTPIRISLANLATSDRVVFQYSAAGIGTQSVSGSQRLWKKNGTSARTASDLIQSGGQGYTAANLGVSGSGVATLYLETVSDLVGAQVLAIGTTGASDKVKIFPVALQTVSRDKYLAGSLEIPAGWDDLSAEFVNTSSLENLGTYNNLTGGGTTKIYDSVDEIMNDADILAGSQPATQKVWFIRSESNPRKLDFYTCFNSVGTVEVRLSRSGQSVLTRSHSLTTAEDFAETIRYVDDWVKGVGFEFSGGGTPPVVLGAPTVNGFGGGDGGIDNLTRAALIPFFNVINQVEGLAATATGLFDGAKAGLNDDWEFLMLVKSGLVAGGGWAWQQIEAELIQWRDDPLKRAGELKNMAMKVCEDWVFKPLQEIRAELSTWNGFKNASWKVWQSVKGTAAKSWTVTRNLWKDIVTGMIDWGNDFCDRMMTGAEKAHWDAVPWARSKLDDDINEFTRQASYTFGYTFGYIAEQVAVGALSAGTVKIAQVTAKGGVHLAANLAKRTAANVAARAHFLKRLLAEAARLPDDLVAAYQRGFAVASTGPTGEAMDKCAMHMMQEAADAGRLVWREYVDNIVGKTNIRQFVKQGSEGIIERRMSQLMHIMGDEFSPQIARNFLKVADEVILVPTTGGNVDEFFEAFFRAFDGNPGLMVNADIGATFSKSQLSAEGKATLKKFLSDPNAGKLWEIDVPAIVDNEPAIPHNYWIRGLLGELAIYKRLYKNAGYTHFPTAPSFDLKSAAEYVQVKTLKNPDGAYNAMKNAVDALAGLPNPPSGLKLHILKKPGSGSDQLKAALLDYIDNSDNPIVRSVKLEIQEFDLIP